jgi:hypothetical protein
MTPHRPGLAQALTADRLAFERARAQAEAAVPGLSQLSERLRAGLGLGRPTPGGPG